MNQEYQPSLVIFSGLPGTGKSTFANRLARERRWPLLRIDDVAGNVPLEADYRFWDEKILLLLTIVEEQLKLGISTIADSVFMGADRVHAQELASKYDTYFRPIYCYVSDEALWKERVTERFEAAQGPNVASWEQIQHQRQWFAPWQPDTGLFIDTVDPFEQNYEKVLEFVVDQSISLTPIQIDVPLEKGKYHE
ncbi:MAG: ATP-binding protein [Anaerolineales bacterium]